MLRSHLTALPSKDGFGGVMRSGPEVRFLEVMGGQPQYWLRDDLLVLCLYQPTSRIYVPKERHEDYGYGSLNAPCQHLMANMVISSRNYQDSIPFVVKCRWCDHDLQGPPNQIARRQ